MRENKHKCKVGAQRLSFLVKKIHKYKNVTPSFDIVAHIISERHRWIRTS